MLYHFSNILIMNSSKLLLIFALLVACIKCQNSIIESRRVNINSVSQLQSGQYNVTFKNILPNGSNWQVAVSITSFSESNSISVNISKISDISFNVIASSSLIAFSYIAIQNSDAFYACGGEITVFFPMPSPIMSLSILSNHSVTIYSNTKNTLNKLATIQPFLSQIQYSPSGFAQKSTIQIGWDWKSNSINVNRSADITKIRVSLLAYRKVGNWYLDVAPIDGMSWFNLANTSESIFVGVRKMSVARRSNYIFNLTNSIFAQATNTEVQLLVAQIKKSNCTKVGVIDSAATMDNCLFNNSCSNFSFQNITVCASFSNFSTPYGQIYNSAMLTSTHKLQANSECNTYETTNNALYCIQCNYTNNFIASGSGSCMCKQGYYSSYSSNTTAVSYFQYGFLSQNSTYSALQQNPQLIQTQYCHQCSETICPFILTTSLKLIHNTQSSSQTIQVTVYFNQQYSYVHPYQHYSYNNLNFIAFVNTKQPITNIVWVSNNQAILTLDGFTISNFYKVSIQTTNSIVLQNQLYQAIYSTPQASNDLQYTRPSPSQLATTTMETITSLTPTASLIAALLGAKVNLFNFVQISSMLYLSSFVKWNNFGSLNRISLSQSLFKFQPTNFFTTFHLALPFPEIYSDDSTSNNIMLTNSSNLMYCSIFPQFILSMLTQILIIQLIIRILSKLFPSSQHPTGYLIESDGKVIWMKKSFLGEYIDSYQKSLSYTLCCIVEKAKTKRFIFYTTLVNSQLIYHSFMIFSQLKINVSNQGQIINTFLSLGFLALIVALPCIGPHTPLILLKCIGVVYKKRQYTISKLFLFYIFGIVESVVYGASIATFSSSLQQCIGVTVIIALKIVLMYKYLKAIQKLKYICLFTFFGLLGFGSYFPTSLQLKAQYLMICLMLGAGLIEILKIVRAVIIAALGFFKQPLSIKGKAIVQKVAEHRNIQINT